MRRVAALAVLCLCAAPAARAARVFGHVTGGPPPARATTVDMYDKYRRDHDLGEVPAPNPLVVILTPEGGAVPARPPAHVVMDQRNERFRPQALVIHIGDTVDFLNSDNFYHNVFSLSATRKFDLGRYRRGQTRSITFDRPGLVKLFCEIHPHMIGFILVTDEPRYAAASPGGDYEIPDVPPGGYRVSIWHEKLGEPVPLARVDVGAGPETRLDLTVAPAP